MNKKTKDKQQINKNIELMKQDKILPIVKKFNEQRVDIGLKDKFHDFCKEVMGIKPIMLMNEKKFIEVKERIEKSDIMRTVPEPLTEQAILSYSFGIFYAMSSIEYVLNWIKASDSQSVEIVDEIWNRFFCEERVDIFMEKQKYYSLERNEEFRKESEENLKNMFPFFNSMDKFSFIVSHSKDGEPDREEMISKSSEVKGNFIFYSHGCFNVYANFCSLLDAVSYEKMFFKL